MKIIDYKKAFTLAEVLITLGIIGIVAAVTIPVLVNIFQNTALKTAFKKAYSNLSQAYNAVTYENGGIPYSCYYNFEWSGADSSDCSVFWTVFKTKLKVVSTYNSNADGINFPYHLSVSEVLAHGGTGESGTFIDRFSSQVWVLADGSMLKAYPNAGFDAYSFFLDTNGLKGPNKWGYDLFGLDFRNTLDGGYNIKIEDEVCFIVEKGGYRIDDILQNK